MTVTLKVVELPKETVRLVGWTLITGGAPAIAKAFKVKNRLQNITPPIQRERFVAENRLKMSDLVITPTH